MAQIPIDVNGTQKQVDIFGNITSRPVAGSVSGYTYNAYAEPSPTPTIQGKMITVSNAMRMESIAASRLNYEEKIKYELARLLVLEMLKSGMIEFTKQSDPATFTIIFRARCFMTPNDQVQILRKNGYK